MIKFLLKLLAFSSSLKSSDVFSVSTVSYSLRLSVVKASYTTPKVPLPMTRLK